MKTETPSIDVTIRWQVILFSPLLPRGHDCYLAPAVGTIIAILMSGFHGGWVMIQLTALVGVTAFGILIIPLGIVLLVTTVLLPGYRSIPIVIGSSLPAWLTYLIMLSIPG